MNKRNELTRITIDIPKINHKKLKATALLMEKSMREIVLEAIESYLLNVEDFNGEIMKRIRNIEEGKNLVETQDSTDLFKKLGM